MRLIELAGGEAVTNVFMFTLIMFFIYDYGYEPTIFGLIVAILAVIVLTVNPFIRRIKYHRIEKRLDELEGKK